MERHPHALIALVVLAGALPLCGALPPPRTATVSPSATERRASWERALSRAIVFAPPRDLGPASFHPDEELTCVIQPIASKGTTRKLYCALKGGEVLKAKYGADNAEVPAELAASRLLAAIGLGTDRMYLVRKLRCFGCDADPFNSYHECLRRRTRPHTWEQKPKSCPEPDLTKYTDFSNVAVERKYPGLRVRAPRGETIDWTSIDRLTAASDAERDALRLVWTLIQHWDDSAGNQRLIGGEDGQTRLVMHDLGASFGSWRAAFGGSAGAASARMNLESWKSEPVFSDRARCLVQRPRGKKGEQTVQIREPGRRLLAARLAKLTDRQLVELFRSAGVDAIKIYGSSEAWARALRSKIKEIQTARCAD